MLSFVYLFVSDEWYNFLRETLLLSIFRIKWYFNWLVGIMVSISMLTWVGEQFKISLGLKFRFSKLSVGTRADSNGRSWYIMSILYKSELWFSYYGFSYTFYPSKKPPTKTAHEKTFNAWKDLKCWGRFHRTVEGYESVW